MADQTTAIVVKARAGDAAAWDQLFRRYQLPLYSYVYELVRHEQESLDIVQETFINAVRHLGSLRDDQKFGSWLFGIAHQKCVQLWRRQNRRRLFEEPQEEEAIEQEASFDGDPSELLLRKEQEEQFLQLLEQLEPPHRAVLLLHFIEEFSLEQIAEITGTNAGTVKSRMHYAKRALRKLLEKEQ
ncbi:MAG: RNA polymerase sigma factor [Limisphaerales bacterium]